MNKLDQYLPFGLTADSLLVILVAGLAFLTVLAVWYGLLEHHPMERRAKMLAERRDQLRGAMLRDKPRKRRSDSLGAMRQVVNALKLMQSQQSDKLNDRLAQAGLRSRDAIVVFLFFKVVTPVLLGAIAFLLVYLLQVGNLSPTGRLLAVVGGIGLGFFAPELYVSNLTKKRQVTLSRGLPDALDLLVICAESGLSLDVALEHEIPSAALRAYFNLADVGIQDDAYQEALDSVTKGLAVARRVGNRYWEWQFLGQVYPFAALGRWDEALDMVRALPARAVDESRPAANAFLGVVPFIHINRGDLDAAAASRAMFHGAEDSADLQERAADAVGAAALARAEGRYEEALASAKDAFAIRGMMGIGHEAVKDAFVEGVEAALDDGRLDDAEEMLTTVEELPPGRLPQYVEAQARRFRARIAMQGEGGAPSIEQGLKNAAGMFREMAVPFWMAVTQLEHAEWLIRQDRGGESKPYLDEAREIFEHLAAVPWLERVARASGELAQAVPT